MHELDRLSGIPLWQQIRDHLMEDITKRSLKPDDPIPPAGTLATNFGVNLHTARRALTELQSAGFIRIEKGRGPFVQAEPLQYKLGERTRFRQNLSQKDRLGRQRYIDSTRLPATSPVDRMLDLRPGTEVILLDLIGEADGVPLCFSRYYLPARGFPGLVERFIELESISETFRHYGIENYARKSTRITARLPSDHEAHHLRQPKNQPVIQTDYIDFDEQGQRIKYTVSCFAGHRIQLTMGDDSVFG